MKTIQSIAFDFSVHGITPRIYGKQGDAKSRYVSISLFDQGAAWPIPSGAHLALRYRLRNGSSGLYDTIDDAQAITFSGNDVTILLANPIFALAGLATCELIITDPSGGISTWSFVVEIEASSTGSSEIPEDYYNAFLGVAAEAAASAAKAESQADRAEAAAGSIDTSNLCSKTMYDPDGAVENAGGIPKYVAANAPQGDFIPASQKNAANGVAPLDGSKKVPAENLPTSDAVNSNVSTTVATSKAVKTAYDKAVAGPSAAATTVSSQNSSSGKATLSGKYHTIGKLVVCQLKLSFSGSMSVGAQQDFSLLVPAPADEFTIYIGPSYSNGEIHSHYNATVKANGITCSPIVSSGLASADSNSVIQFTLCYVKS